MEIWTGQLAKWRVFQKAGLEVIDTTVRSGLTAFAPTWDIVMGVKGGTLSEDEYSRVYYDLMRQSWATSRGDWDNLLAKERFVICCYCPPGKFCHRHLLKDLVIKLATRQGLTVIDQGELTHG